MFDVSSTTISRIKHGVNHCKYIEEYHKMSLEERRNIYNLFCEKNNFYEAKTNKSSIAKIRKLNEEQVHLILCNFEFNLIPLIEMMKRFNIKSDNTLRCIKNGITYKDYSYTYNKLNMEEKQKLVTLLSNQ